MAQKAKIYSKDHSTDLKLQWVRYQPDCSFLLIVWKIKSVISSLQIRSPNNKDILIIFLSNSSATSFV